MLGFTGSLKTVPSQNKKEKTKQNNSLALVYFGSLFIKIRAEREWSSSLVECSPSKPKTLGPDYSTTDNKTRTLLWSQLRLSCLGNWATVSFLIPGKAGWQLGVAREVAL